MTQCNDFLAIDENFIIEQNYQNWTYIPKKKDLLSRLWRVQERWWLCNSCNYSIPPLSTTYGPPNDRSGGQIYPPSDTFGQLMYGQRYCLIPGLLFVWVLKNNGKCPQNLRAYLVLGALHWDRPCSTFYIKGVTWVHPSKGPHDSLGAAMLKGKKKC